MSKQGKGVQKRGEKRKRHRHGKRITIPWKPVLIVVAIIFLVTVAYLVSRGDTSAQPGTPVAVMPVVHIADVQSPHVPYNSNPPTSGPHVSLLARWGIHSDPIPPEVQVHNLEHGGVLVQYSSLASAALIGQLEGVVSRYEDHVILAPYFNMDSQIALTAWGRIDKFDEWDEDRIVEFIEAYRGIDHH
ncbi:MAG: DUF3105 domain-containing protein [Dehalococcoidia bacterium]